jgi:hypothetical protein
MAKNKTRELPPAAAGQGDEPARERSRPLWKVSGPYGHAERVVEAADEDGAWAAYLKAEGLLAADLAPVVVRVETNDAVEVGK